jgi:hypothetical protein
MPIIVKRRPRVSSPTPPCATTVSPAPQSRRRRLDDHARDLAPKIAQIRKAGFHSNAEIAERLNDEGLNAPSGGRFARETVRRIQKKIEQLGLGDGSRTRSAALKARHDKKRVRDRIEWAPLHARAFRLGFKE